MNRLKTHAAAKAQRQSAGPLDAVLARLASLKFALVIVSLIALACVAGTLIPQGSQVGDYMAQHPGASGVMKAFDAVGLTHVFYTWWFIALLTFLPPAWPPAPGAVSCDRAFNGARPPPADRVLHHPRQPDAGAGRAA